MFIYGRNVLIEALRSEVEIHEINLERDIKKEGKIEEIINLAKKKRVNIEYVDKKKLTYKSNSDEHQGVGAHIMFKLHNIQDIFKASDSLNKSYIYITEATYEHNVGAIIRSAECAGFGGVLIPNDMSINSTIVKISAGAALHIPVISIGVYQAIKDFSEQGFKIAGIERDGTNLYKSDLSFPTLFIIGGEDKSLSENLRDRCDEILEIPQSGKVNSLNMSVATAIVIFEHVRQKSNV